MPAKRKRAMSAASRKRTHKNKVRRFFGRSRLSQTRFLVFVLVFGAIGSFLIWHSFAATTTANFSGRINKQQQVRTHSVTATASGTLSASLSYTKLSSASLVLLSSNGSTLATGTGTNPVILNAPVTSGTYTLRINGAGSGSYTLSVNYPLVDTAPGDTSPPSAPSNLTATATNTSQINLSWGASTDNVGVTGYDVYRNNVKITTTVANNYSDLNLTPTTSYSYFVKAHDAAGNVSAASNSASATTQTPPDTIPPSVTITSPTGGATLNGTANVSGTSGDNVGVTKVELSVDSSGFVPVNGTTTWNYSLNTTLYTNTTHTISIRATDTSGNQKATSISITISNQGSTGGAPNTQGTWVSPEGATFNVNTAGAWTLAQIYQLIKSCGAQAGDFAMLAPTLTVTVQDTYSSQMTSWNDLSNGRVTMFGATIYLRAVNDNFATRPDDVACHEYGHFWNGYRLYLTHQGDRSSYLAKRWVTADGSVTLATDPRLDSSYSWNFFEINADDFRLLLGTPLSITERPSGMQPDMVDPRNQPGLKDWYLQHWKTGL